MALLKILIIGGTGLLGKTVYKFLNESNQYDIALLLRPKNKGNSVFFNRVFEGDILNQKLLFEAVEWADLVINCSGLVSYSRSDRKHLYKVNVEGVNNILSACSHFKKPLLHTSSAIAYGSSSDPIAFTESCYPTNVFRGAYAQSKFDATNSSCSLTFPTLF